MSKSIYFYFSVYKSLIKTMFQLMKGIWKISRLPGPIVSIFGGSKLATISPYEVTAHELAGLLIKHNISVITGGGSGIMEAANCGAFHAESETGKVRSIGITVKGLEKEEFNFCAQDKMVVDYFFVRKWLMANYSVAFAFFPGGFGTLDEFGEVITLMQTKKLAGAPVVLIGRAYWTPFITWLHDYALRQNLISLQDLAMVQITDDADEALRLLREHCSKCQ
jgi:uncharacterized protein (TIGR00730 family)